MCFIILNINTIAFWGPYVIYLKMMEDTKMQHRIGVISDTHLPRFAPIPASIWDHFADVELIIHAGDLSLLSVISQLETIAPVVAVQGNVEREEVVESLP